jgi:hypothetical protein
MYKKGAYKGAFEWGVLGAGDRAPYGVKEEKFQVRTIQNNFGPKKERTFQFAIDRIGGREKIYKGLGPLDLRMYFFGLDLSF